MPYVVGFGSKTTVALDLSKHLTAAGRTITGTPTVTVDAGSVSNVTGTTTAVLWRFDATSITGPSVTTVTATVTSTLDNGDVDVRWETIQVTKPG